VTQQENETKLTMLIYHIWPCVRCEN